MTFDEIRVGMRVYYLEFGTSRWNSVNVIKISYIGDEAITCCFEGESPQNEFLCGPEDLFTKSEAMDVLEGQMKKYCAIAVGEYNYNEFREIEAEFRSSMQKLAMD